MALTLLEFPNVADTPTYVEESKKSQEQVDDDVRFGVLRSCGTLNSWRVLRVCAMVLSKSLYRHMDCVMSRWGNLAESDEGKGLGDGVCFDSPVQHCQR